MEAAREDLYKFFAKSCGIKPQDFVMREANMLRDVFEILKEFEGRYDSTNVYFTIYYELCTWPPFIKRHPTFSDSDSLVEVIPRDIVKKFLKVLFNYLNQRFPNTYVYDSKSFAIKTISSRENRSSSEDDE